MHKILNTLLCFATVCSCLMCSSCKKSEGTVENNLGSTVSQKNENISSVSSDKIPDDGYVTIPKPDDLSGWREHPEDYKLIALTFDDAPAFNSADSNYTRTIIDTLAEHDGKSTLFVIGQSVVKNGESLLKYALSKGFEIGNHGFTHTAIGSLSSEECYNEIEDCSDIIEDISGKRPLFFRPPMLSVGDGLFEACSELKISPILMGGSLNSLDYEPTTTADDIVNRIRKNAYDGSIVLLHSKYAVTADAIKPLCKVLYDDGYRFCTLSELFYFKGKEYVPTSQAVTDVYFD